MRWSRSLVALLAEGLALASLTVSHPDTEHIEESRRLQKRVGFGAQCGPAAGNAICDPGLCCSEAGICGTGTAFCGGPGCQLSFGPACDGNQTPAGTDTAKIPRPRFGNVPFGVDISHCSVPGKVALTFDDGPYIYTTEILDLLKRNQVRATFFVVGNNGGKGQINDPKSGYGPIIQRMIAEGHQVGSHSWSHQDLNAATPAQRRAQILNNEIALNDILGVIPTYFRPPMTRCGVDCYADLASFGYHVLNYDIDTRDWQDGGVNAKSTYQTILSQHSPANSQWISLAHDIQPFTVHEFAQFEIDTARKLGYDLVTVGECLGDPPANWYRDPVTGQARDAKGARTQPFVQAQVAPLPPSHTTSSSLPTTPVTSSNTSTRSSSITPTTVANVDFGLGKTSASLNSTGIVTASGGTHSGVTVVPVTSPTSTASGAGPRVAVPGVLAGLGRLMGILFTVQVQVLVSI